MKIRVVRKRDANENAGLEKSRNSATVSRQHGALQINLRVSTDSV